MAQQPSGGLTIRDYVQQEAEKLDIPASLALAIIQRESEGRQRATSEKGARGFFQLMPETARDLGVNPEDPFENIQGGLRYFKQQYDAFGGDVRLALAAYNAGPARIVGGRVPDIPETQDYVRRVLALWQQGGTAAPSISPRVATPPPAAATRGMLPPSRIETPLAVPPPEPRPSILSSIASGFDPRTRQGRRNLAATAASVGAGAAIGAGAGAPAGGVGAVPGAIGGGITGGIRAAVPIIAAAGLGGALEEAGEQLVGTAPPSLGAIAGAGAEQAGMEAVGGVVAWPLKAVGRRIAAPLVAKGAAEKLTAARESLTTGLQTALDTATQSVEAVRKRLQGIRPSVSASQAGELAGAVMRGPAAEARRRAGTVLDEVARAGPERDITPLKAQAQDIFEREIQGVATAFSGQAGAAGDPEVQGLLKNLFTGGRVTSAEEKAAFVQKLTGKGLDPGVAQATVETAAHPAMGVLRRVLNAPDRVPFKDLHELRKEFDQVVHYDSTARKKVEQITKGLAGGMRSLLGEYEPFRAVADAYARIVPLYEKGIAPKIRKQILDNPEEVIDQLRPAEPTRAAHFRDLLVQQAGRGGGQQQGEAAWNAVRAAWTYEKLIAPGADTLKDRLVKLETRPEFIDVLYGDPTGQMVFRNLHQIGDAMTLAKETVEAVRGSITAAKPSTDLEKRLARFIRGTRPLDEEAADVIRATFLGPGSIWGGLSIVRLLRGPKLNDLVQWASYAPERTQMLVRATTSPAGGLMMSTLLRAAHADGAADWAGALFEQRARQRERAVGLVGAPPPAP